MLDKYLSNLIGKSTNRKIVVIEVDDFGVSRLNDGKIDSLKDKFQLDYFAKHDRMVSNKDLSDLFEALTSVKDINERHAVLTPLTIMVNPDFEKIRNNHFQQYFYEPFTATLERAYGKEVFELWNEGIKSGIFSPEFHGREHFNLNMWINALKIENSKTREAFEYGIVGVFDNDLNSKIKRFGASFDFENINELVQHESILIDGIKIFNQIFGYRPTLFTPPNSRFSKKLEDVLLENGIKTISIPKIRLEPIGHGNVKKSFNYFGKKNKNGLIYTPRNCQFEPHSNKGKDDVDCCLKDINIAFTMRKPAIISSHRINFVNNGSKFNGDGTKKLKVLLQNIVKKWPDVEFLSSQELYKSFFLN